MENKKLKNIELIIFDFDGTLLDSKADVAAAINRMLLRYGEKPISPDKVWSFLGDGAGYLVDRCFEFYAKSSPEGSVDFFLKDYIENSLKQTRLYPGVLETLSKLAHYKMAILTNKLHDLTVKMCKNLGIIEHFELVLGRGGFNKKPEPDGIYIILDKLDIKPENAVIVGDTLIDMTAADRASIRKIAVSWGVHDKKTLLKSKPDGIIDKIEDLPTLLA